EDEQGDGHRGGDLTPDAGRLALAAPEVLRESAGREPEHDGAGDDDHEDDDRNDLCDRHNGVDEGRLLDAAQDHEMYGPQDGRGEAPRQDRAATPDQLDRPAEPIPDSEVGLPGERVFDQAHGGHYQDEIGDVADGGPGPVAQRGNEAEVVAEARLGVGVDAGVEIGLSLGERLEHPRERVHAAAG